MRELAYVDRTPELKNTGAVVMSGNSLMRVNTLSPVTYDFEVGPNEIPEPYTFINPTDRKEISESILTWKGVQYLIKQGVFEAFTDTGIVTAEKLDKENAKLAKLAEKNAKKNDDEAVDVKVPKKKSLSDVANNK